MISDCLKKPGEKSGSVFAGVVEVERKLTSAHFLFIRGSLLGCCSKKDLSRKKNPSERNLEKPSPTKLPPLEDPSKLEKAITACLDSPLSLHLS